MSDIIQLLPDSVANQIAAGEVIQRPASVIKELVENAVDAGATAIHVVVVDAGRTLIQVVDNGCGMSETDARLAFERHATSKIRQAADLFDLHTMGFRGEALPSIAAVAQVELTTRMAADDLGTRITLAGSRVTGQETVSCPAGSNFKIENLFFNVPARRKFLKSNATELGHILTSLERIVLVYPAIAFTLKSNGQELLNLRSGSLRQRIADVFGKKIDADLLPINADTSLCRIKGFVGKPESAKRKGAHNYFFVNGRYMRHVYFHKAVTSAFERTVPEGMTVSYFIYFEVAPTDIDVNIHPTKTEIKFENEQSIFPILSAAVKDAIGKFCDVPTIDFDTQGRPEMPVYDPSAAPVDMPKVSYNPDYNPFRASYNGPSRTKATPDDWQKLYAGATAPDAQAQPLFEEPEAPSDDAEQLIADKSPVHYQFKGRYIMTAVRSGLMIIDQHRADIRSRYEHYLDQLAHHALRSQRLLFPEVVQLSPADALVLRPIMGDLSEMGIDISDLGGDSFAVNALPADLPSCLPSHLIEGIVADASQGNAQGNGDFHSSLALTMARHGALAYGQALTNEEMETVVNRLFACSNVNYTPDGKAILCILPGSDIEELLG